MSKGPLKIALVQTNLFWKDKTANLAMLEEKILNLDNKVDMVILPEMFSTGFSMDAEEIAEPMNFITTRWMKQMAAQTNALVTGSVVIKEDGMFYNRLMWVTPEGEIGFYDKRHLFRMADEHTHYSMGTGKKVIEWKGWRILPQVCYDLRFPVWSRNWTKGNKPAYDLVYYVASWPSPRISAWDILLKARAIENLSYSLGVNRIGVDGNAIPYSGHSAAYNFKGDTLVFSEDKEEILYVTLDLILLEEYREKFPAWIDADRFNLE